MRSFITKILFMTALMFAVGTASFVCASSTDDGGHEAVQTSAQVSGAIHEGGAVAHEANSEEHHGGFPPAAKWKDLFWRTVNFVALVVLLVYFLGKPISNGLTGRQKQVREELEELEGRRDEAQQSYREFTEKLAGMEKEMEQVVEKAIAQAKNEKERILAEAEKAAEDIKRQAEAAVQAEVVDARRRLLVDAADAAAGMAEELIVKNLTPEDQKTITEQYLQRVGAVR
ncbi:MAG: ATPase [Desulfobulbus propionicus]|nr:MAG: ATPase [Desulfobulbus propionicus]